MKRSLVVSVRFYEGRYHGTGGWPPAPARLFQALMAGAARGASVSQATLEALDWLEELPYPVILAPRSVPGQRYSIYVPNNDLDAKLPKKGTLDIDEALAKIRAPKLIRPILFNASKPVLYCWPIDGETTRAGMLCEAANNLYQLGRGIDMAWAEAAVVSTDDAQKQFSDYGGVIYRPSMRAKSDREFLCPQPGSRRSLTKRFEGMCNRFRVGGTNRKPVRVFVQPPKPILAKVAYEVPPVRFVYEFREGNAKSGFVTWRLNEASQLVRDVRDQAAQHLCDAVSKLSNDVEHYLIGRDATDIDKASRVRIVPIPSIGHPHADMMIRRLVVYVPQSCPLRADDLAWAFAQVVWADNDGVVMSALQRADDGDMVERYEHFGHRWQSVTPLALMSARRRRIDPSRLPEKAKGGNERAREEMRAAHAVYQALRHAGVEVPPTDVRVQREPFDARGERAEPFATGTRFPKEALWHVAASFAEPVEGPLLLGDGRYLGLGLMRPAERAFGVFVFSIRSGLTDAADSSLVAHAMRRAMMARVQNNLPRGQSIPSYVSGHEKDGAPAAGGIHRHIAITADLPRQRILFIAPDRLQRYGIKWRDVRQDHDLVERAMEGMDILRAGKAGRLTIVPSVVEMESDPLFAPARIWESITDYHVTRHRRRLTDEEALESDVLTELRRCGWPVPKAVEVLAVWRGPRGGLSGRLRIVFASAQAGPLLLGRTVHKGGGLFGRAALTSPNDRSSS